MTSMCLDQYRSDSSLLALLDSLRVQYAEMIQSEKVSGEEDTYFTELLGLIDTLQVKMK